MDACFNKVWQMELSKNLSLKDALLQTCVKVALRSFELLRLHLIFIFAIMDQNRSFNNLQYISVCKLFH